MTAINNQNVDALLTRIDGLNLGGANEVQGVKNELETLFSETNTINGGDKGAQKIAEKIASLEEKIGELEEKAQKILERIETKNEEVKSKQNDLAYSAADITAAMTEFQKETAQAARQAAQDAVISYKRGKGVSSFQQCFDQAFRKRLGGLQANQSEIQMLWQIYEQNRGSLISITSDIETAINQVTGLETQLKNVNATIKLLNTTKNAMLGSTVENAYTNSDLDSSIPVFSGAKAKVANEVIKNAGNVPEIEIGGSPSTNQNSGDVDIVNPGEEPRSLENIKAEYANKNAGTGYNATWHATISRNPQLQNLSDRINKDHMIEDLQNHGASADEILKFISENWQVGLRRNVNQDGSISYFIPNNSGGDEAVYSKLNELALSGSANTNTNAVGVQRLKDSALVALDKMYQAGFTFKEAMYTMSLAYPDSNIGYDINNQSTRNYTIPKDTDGTDGIYKNISDKIQNYWNVGGEETTIPSTPSITTQRGHSDPIVFQEGNTTYTFIQDRDNDNKFDFTNGSENELLGSKNGIQELLQYDYNDDGIINSNDIDENGNSALDNLMMIANHQNESVNTPFEVDEYKHTNIFENNVDFEVSYTSAKDAGITSIDLTAIKESGLISGEDNVEEDYTDVNGSNVINQFAITKDGKEIIADETLNTESNLNIFYGQIANHSGNASNISSIQSKEDVDLAFKEAEVGSEVISNVLSSLREMKYSPDTDYTYGDITLTEDDIHTITGLSYLTSVMENARKAAEDKMDDTYEAKDAAEEAVNDYFENRIFAQNGKEKESEEDEEK